MKEQIYEEGEYCEKCLGVENLGKWELGGSPATICSDCWDDKPGFKKWFLQELEEVLERSDEYEKISDGKWRRKPEKPNSAAVK